MATNSAVMMVSVRRKFLVLPSLWLSHTIVPSSGFEEEELGIISSEHHDEGRRDGHVIGGGDFPADGRGVVVVVVSDVGSARHGGLIPPLLILTIEEKSV